MEPLHRRRGASLKDLLRLVATLCFLFCVVAEKVSAPDCPLDNPKCVGVWQSYEEFYKLNNSVSLASAVLNLVLSCIWLFFALLSSWSVYHLAFRLARDYVTFITFVGGEYVAMKTFAYQEWNNVKGSCSTFFLGEYAVFKAYCSWNLLLLKCFVLSVTVLAFFFGFRPKTFMLEPQAYSRHSRKAQRFFSLVVAFVSFLLLFSYFLPSWFAKMLRTFDQWLRTLREFKKASADAENFADSDFEGAFYREEFDDDEPVPKSSNSTDKGKEPDDGEADVPLRRRQPPVFVPAEDGEEEILKAESLPGTYYPSSEYGSDKPIIGEVECDPSAFCKGCNKPVTGFKGSRCDCFLRTSKSNDFFRFNKGVNRLNIRKRRFSTRQSRNCDVCGKIAINAGRGNKCYKHFRGSVSLVEQTKAGVYSAGDDMGYSDEAVHHHGSTAGEGFKHIYLNGIYLKGGMLLTPFLSFCSFFVAGNFDAEKLIDVAKAIYVTITDYQAKIRGLYTDVQIASSPILRTITQADPNQIRPTPASFRREYKEFYDELDGVYKATGDFGMGGHHFDMFTLKDDVLFKRLVHPDTQATPFLAECGHFRAFQIRMRMLLANYAKLCQDFENSIYLNAPGYYMSGTTPDQSVDMIESSVSIALYMSEYRIFNVVSGFIKRHAIGVTAVAAFIDLCWLVAIVMVGYKFSKRVMKMIIAFIASYFLGEEAWTSRGQGRRKRKKFVNSAGQAREDEDAHPDDDYYSDSAESEDDVWFERVHGETRKKPSTTASVRFSQEDYRRFTKLRSREKNFPPAWENVCVMKHEALLTSKSKFSVGFYADNLFQLSDSTGTYFVNAFRVGNNLFTVKHALKQLQFGQVKNHKSSFTISTDKVVDWGRDLVSFKVAAGKKYMVRSPKMGEYCVLISFGPQTFGKLFPEVSYGTTDGEGFYTCDSVSGNCGGVVVALSDGAVLGVHAAGSRVINYYERFTKDRLEKMNLVPNFIDSLRNMEDQMPLEIDPQSLRVPGFQTVFAPKMDVDSIAIEAGLNPHGFTQIGTINRKGFSVNQRKPDPLVVEFSMAEGVQFPFDQFELTVTQKHSVASSLNHFNRVERDFDEKALAKAVRWVLRIMEPHVGGSRVAKTFDLFEKLDKTTSAGFPYNIMKMSKEDVEKKHKSEVLKQASDPTTTFVMMEAMKEEVRPTEKVDKGDQRGIWGGPVAMSILGLYLFGDMADRMHAASAGQWYSFVGATIFDGNWDKVFKLLDKHPNGWALDAKKWDSSLLCLLLQAACHIRIQLLHPDDRTPYNLSLIYNLYRNIIHTVFLTPWGLFLLKRAGNPSGGPLTIDDNTIILLLNAAYTWIRKSPKHERTLASFRSNVSAFLNGDDNTFTVSDEAAHWYNGKALAECASELGVTFDTDHWEPRPASQLDFLSANFHPTVYGMVPLYNTDKLLVSLYYSRKRDPCDTLIRACALHVIGFWDKHFRGVMSDFIKWLIKKYSYRVDDDWNRALTAYHSDDAIVRLYFGFEVGKRNKDKQAPQKLNQVFGPPILFHQQSLQSMSTKKNVNKQLAKAKVNEQKAETKLVKQEIKALAKAPNALSQHRNAASTAQRVKTKTLQAKKNPHVLKYLRALVDPESFYRDQQSARVPDAFSKATATLNSFGTYNVTTNASADTQSSDLGRFAFVTNPSLASMGWLYTAGPSYEQYGRNATIGSAIRFEDSLVLAANVAEVDPALEWSPATTLQAPTPSPLDSRRVFKGAPSLKPEAPPVIPQYSSWITYADPNATAIGGNLVTSTVQVPSLQYQNGAAESLRPVGHCVWFQPSMAALANGGNVSIALLPPGSILGQVVPYNFNNCTTGTALWGGQGPVTNWENLAKVPGAYTGALADGAYAYWVPSKISDIDMVSTAQNSAADFPIIVVAGQWQGNTGSDTPFDGIIGTLRVTTLYEYTTCDQSRSTTKIDCVPGVFDFVQCMLKNQPTSMENKAHRSWIDKLLAGAAGVLAGGAAFLVSGPAGAIAAGSAAAGGVYAALKD